MAIPKYQDDVKHKKNEYTGRVIAVHVELTPNGPITYFDVRGTDDQIYYHTPAKNWEVVNTEEERYD